MACGRSCGTKRMLTANKGNEKNIRIFLIIIFLAIPMMLLSAASLYHLLPLQSTAKRKSINGFNVTEGYIFVIFPPTQSVKRCIPSLGWR